MSALRLGGGAAIARRDAAGLERLSREECLELLATVHAGRLGIHIDALPAILPVNFALVDGEIVFRCAPASRLAAATSGAVVAFEADQFGSRAGPGWSVLVIGVAGEVSDPVELGRLQNLPLTPWSSDGSDDRFMRVYPEIISGRRQCSVTKQEPGPDRADGVTLTFQETGTPRIASGEVAGPEIARGSG